MFYRKIIIIININNKKHEQAATNKILSIINLDRHQPKMRKT